MSVSRNYTGCGPLPPQVVAVLPNAEELAQACARTVFASQWGDAIERAQIAEHYPEREESERDAAPEEFELSNLSGRDLCEEAPHDNAPARFLAYARDAVAQTVAALFADAHAGGALLDKLRDADPADAGHTLALDVLGTGADDWSEHDAEALGEYVPRMDCDGRLYLSLGEVHEPDALTDSDLRRLRNVRGEALTNSERAHVAELVTDSEASASDVLDNVAEALGFGDVQSLTLPDDDTQLHYVNTGETYQDTLTWDGDKFRVQSWGAALEAAEEARTFATGETRCPYCSDWGNLLGKKPCESCGHAE